MKECGLPETVTFKKEAQSVLGFAIEQMLCLFFHRAHLCATHAKRKSIQAVDLAFGETLSNESKVVKSLEETQRQMILEAEECDRRNNKKRRCAIREARSPKTPAPKAPRVRSPSPEPNDVN